jgi:hypothetical protein
MVILIVDSRDDGVPGGGCLGNGDRNQKEGQKKKSDGVTSHGGVLLEGLLGNGDVRIGGVL